MIKLYAFSIFSIIMKVLFLAVCLSVLVASQGFILGGDGFRKY